MTEYKGYKKGLVLPWLIVEIYKYLDDWIKSIENAFLAGLALLFIVIMTFAIIILIIYSVFWNWMLPTSILGFWLILEGIHALGKWYKNR